MDRGKKAKSSIAIILTVILICFAFSLNLYAWIVMQKPSDGAFGFTASGLSELVLQMGCVASGGEEESRVYSKENCLPKQDSFGLLHPVATNGKYSVLLSDMVFGSIDNLSRLKPENKIYFRLTVPKALGKNISLDISHPATEDPFSVYYNEYDANGAVTSQIKLTDAQRLDALKAIVTPTAEKPSPAQYLQFSYAFSATAFDANAIEAAVNATEEADKLVFVNSEEGNPFPIMGQGADGMALSISCPDDAYDAASEYYYLYLLMTPNLSVFAYSVEYLAEIMPCLMLFNVKMDFDIK